MATSTRAPNGLQDLGPTVGFQGRSVTDQPPSLTSPAKSLLDVDGVADRLDVSSKTVRRHIDRGDLAVHRIGRLLRVSEEDLANFVARRRQVQSKESV
jgi:excisionase family DNA binding protein